MSYVSTSEACGLRSCWLGSQPQLAIIDARSVIAARGNSVKGAGTEDSTRYSQCRLLFMDIGNIHAMRSSAAQLAQAVRESCDSQSNCSEWLGSLLSWLVWLRKAALSELAGLAVLGCVSWARHCYGKSEVSLYVFLFIFVSLQIPI